MNPRYQQLCQWLSQQTGDTNPQLTSVAGDASFRRYYRLETEQGSRIVMDAPPPEEDCAPFVSIAQEWFQQGVAVPEIFAQDLEQGFLLLEDFGDQQLLPLLEQGAQQADPLYQDAIDALLQIQTTRGQHLPHYDDTLLMREMELFREWFCQKWLALELTEADHQLIDNTFTYLSKHAQAQPQVTVHRDYHSRNLMLTPEGKHNIGIIDFQDAVYGPITYDLLSLLRDAYITWPKAQLQHWQNHFWRQLEQKRQTPTGYKQEQFIEDFDMIGAQRHLKVVGIFARLWLRDGKSGYLADIPRTFDHLLEDCKPYPQLAEFTHWLQSRIQPALEEKQSQQEVPA